MKGARTHFNQRSLAFIVLITGVVGGLLIVFSILLLCKYCLNRRNLREAEQMKLLYETLNQISLNDSTRLCHRGLCDGTPLEPRRSNPLDRYHLAETQWQIPVSKQISSDYHSTGSQHSHNPSFHDSREQTSSKQLDTHAYNSIDIDEETSEQSYLQVDPRCYVRQNSQASIFAHRKSDTPRLEKGHSLNVDTRPSPSSTSLSPYRQSSFDVPLACRTPQQQQQMSTPSPSQSTQQDIYYTPRGSCLSIMANPLLPVTTSGSQHLSAPTASNSRKNSAGLLIEKKDLTAILDLPEQNTSHIRSTIVQREHEYSKSLEQSSPPIDQSVLSSINTTVDKQSRSFDAVHLLRPGSLRPDTAVNRRTKSYEYADEHRSARPSIAPPPIVIKIPDMTELVQAAQFSQFQTRRDSQNLLDEYQRTTGRKRTLIQQVSLDDQNQNVISPEDMWRLRQSYELEEQEREKDDQPLGQTSPEDFSVDLLTSTSIDSAGAMAIDMKNNSTMDDDPSKYQHRRKSSSNLLLPPPEVRRQALRRTFEKRRSCINQSNARREQQEFAENQNEFDDENTRTTNSKLDFTNLLKNFNTKSENSSFERSLETDFDMQSDTSSRGPNDQFTSIESSGNENPLPDVNNRLATNRRCTTNAAPVSPSAPLLPPPSPLPSPAPQQQSPQLSPHQDDSGYKSLESQNSQNRTFSLDWMSADGAESVIYLGESRLQQRSVDVKDLEDQLNEVEEKQNPSETQRNLKLMQTGFHHSYQEHSSTALTLPISTNGPGKQQRSLSTNIPLVENHLISPPINHLPISSLSSSNNKSLTNNNKLITSSSSFIRTASKKRREFGKDKRHVSSQLDKISLPTVEPSSITVEQINETTIKSPTSSASLQVRHPDLRRTKSDESRNGPGQIESLPTSNPTESSGSSRLSSSTDGILTNVASSSSLPGRQHLSPHPHQILQRSPSSTTPPVTRTTPAEAFRSQRGSLSFDTRNPLINPSTSTIRNKSISTTNSILPHSSPKPRLKFSTVRDSTSSTLPHNAPVYSMPITRDYSIDEKTNRIVNEFLLYDPTFDENTRRTSEDLSARNAATKRHHHHHHHSRVRAKTFDEQMPNQNSSSSPTTGQKQLPQQPPRSPTNKQRHPSSIQTNTRKSSQHQYPNVHQIENNGNGDENHRPSSIVNLFPVRSSPVNSSAHIRRENSIATASPSIIITGYDSGS